MKKIVAFTLITLLAVQAEAQGDSHVVKWKDGGAKGCPKVYLGISGGVNNFCGITGISLDVPVGESVSMEGGVGISTWGTKLGIGAKYYFGPCHTGWALGAGFTHNTGLGAFNDNMGTIYGNEDVTLDLKPQTNMYVAGYRYWPVGKKGNRMFITAGWSFRLSSELYTESYGDPLSSVGDRVLNIIAPGGLMFGGGFAFGLGR